MRPEKMEADSMKLLIIEYFLKDARGHGQSYAFSIAQGAMSQGIRAEVWCPRNYEGETPAYLKKCLLPFEPGGMNPHAFMRAAKRAFEISSLLRKAGLEKGDLVLFPSLDNTMLLTISISSLLFSTKAKAVAILRRDLRSIYQTLSLPKALAISLANEPFMWYLNRLKGMAFASDSEEITDELLRYGMKGAFTLPIPHTVAAVPHAKGSPFLVGYLGEARLPKGFDLLPEIVETSMKKDSGISFAIQTVLDKSAPGDPALAAASQKLEKLQLQYPGRLRLIGAGLSREKYLGLMGECSALLLPYRGRSYGKGTSGIMAEAISMGKWVIAPADTWMSRQGEKYSKIVAFTGESPFAISAAVICSKKKDPEVGRKDVENEIAAWRSYHSVENYIKVLFNPHKA